jgi:hypothetical protein
MGFIAFISPALTVLAWTVWGLLVLHAVMAVLVDGFKQMCKAYHEYKVAFFKELHKQSQEDADEISSQFWEKMK